jgi:hypothetical protein
MFFYYHPECHGYAFATKIKPPPMGPLTTNGLLHLNGKPMKPFLSPQCDSCGHMLWEFRTTRFVDAP